VRVKRASRFPRGLRGSIVPLLATIALASMWIAVPGTGASAIVNTCQARNATKDGSNRSDLQGVIDAASPGDRVEVRNVCVGTFVIAKDLTIVGRSTTAVPRPILDGRAQDSVLTVDATVTIANLAITHGAKPTGTGDNGGGIANTGTLTLRNVVVRANTGEGGGIYNAGTLIMNGSTSVRHNYAGGILNDGMLTMNDTSSVTENRWRSAIFGVGDLTMNDSSTVARHRHFAGITTEGSIILNDAASVRDNDAFYGIWLYAGGELIMNGSSSVANNAGGIANEGTATLNDSASVHGNHARRGGGIFNLIGSVLVMNGSSIVQGNAAERAGGGIFNLGTATLNGSAAVRGNRSNGPGGGITNKLTLDVNGNSVIAGNKARTNGGGISNRDSGSVTLNNTPSIRNNTADADGDGNGVGGGILCDTGSVTGAVDGGNVNDNYRGNAPPVEDNIVTRSC
jgi:hypothetical protein